MAIIEDRRLDEIAERFGLDRTELALEVRSLDRRGLLEAVAALGEVSAADIAAEHGLSLTTLLDLLDRLPEPSSMNWTLGSHERDVLVQAGIDVGDDVDVLAPRAAAELDQLQLESDSLRVAEAARILHCSDSRVRQRLLDPPSLLGFRRPGGRRELLLPRFQFDIGLHRLDAWAQLLRALPSPREVAPAPLVVWLTTPLDRYDGRSRAEQVRRSLTDELLAEAASYSVSS